MINTCTVKSFGDIAKSGRYSPGLFTSTGPLVLKHKDYLDEPVPTPIFDATDLHLPLLLAILRPYLERK